MANAYLFSPKSMTAQQYDECIRKLEAAGAGHPPGRLFHACYGTGDQLRVFDIWESEETFGAFGPILGPILAELGVDPGTPQVMPVHHTLP